MDKIEKKNLFKIFLFDFISKFYFRDLFCYVYFKYIKFWSICKCNKFYFSDGIVYVNSFILVIGCFLYVVMCSSLVRNFGRGGCYNNVNIMIIIVKIFR